LQRAGVYCRYVHTCLELPSRSDKPKRGPSRSPNRSTSLLRSRMTTEHEPGTIALDLTCAECGRSPRAGETWRILFADIGEAVTYCPECAEREFGEAGVFEG
jgi:hypothetical protein